jgi:hypothetical protein
MELAALLEQAQSAPRDRRIEWRDPIAAHGATAIEGVRPWLADGELAAFAVRVIEQAGIGGEPQLAAKVLRAARTRVPDSVTGDVVWALQRLKTTSRPAQPERPAPAPVGGAVRREPARFPQVARRRTR